MTTEKRRSQRVLARIQIPEFLRRDSEFARWLALLWFGTGTMLGVGLIVVGTGLAALGLAVILHGFGVVTLSISNQLGPSLAAGLVTGVLGGLALGLGVESQAGHGYLRRPAEPWEVVVAHLPGLIVFVWLLGVARSLLQRVIEDAPAAFGLIPRYLDAVGGAWAAAAFVGLPALWAIYQFMVPKVTRIADYAPGIVYLVWVIAALNRF